MSSNDADPTTGVRCSPGAPTGAADDPLAQLAAVLDDMAERHPSDLPPEALGRQLLDLEAALAALRTHERYVAGHLAVRPWPQSDRSEHGRDRRAAIPDGATVEPRGGRLSGSTAPGTADGARDVRLHEQGAPTVRDADDANSDRIT